MRRLVPRSRSECNAKSLEFGTSLRTYIQAVVVLLRKAASTKNVSLGWVGQAHLEVLSLEESRTSPRSLRGDPSQARDDVKLNPQNDREHHPQSDSLVS